MPGAEVRHHPHDVGTAIVGQAPGDDLQSVRDGPVGKLPRARDRLGLLLEPGRQLHLRGAAAWQHPGLQDDVPRHAKRILQVALHLVEHVSGGAAEDDRAGLGVLALRHEGEVLVADLLDLKQAALGSNGRLGQLLGAVADRRAGDAGDAVVVRLADAADHGDVRLEQEVLRQVGDTLLCDHKVRLDLDDVFAHLLHLILFLLQQLLPIGFLGDLDVGLALALLVLQRAIQQHHPRVLDHAAHPRVSDVLVKHDSVQDHALRELTARKLLHLGVALEVDFLTAVGLVDAHHLRRLDRQV
mmetsp:Transcript_96815/g.260329  ORF Transcript_96815/g.260329 Transcript_96815/m.260329 type:complete len:299 (+) Transcript_96815:355-1251(+)